MTATMFHKCAVEDRVPSSASPLLRLQLAPTGSAPRPSFPPLRTSPAPTGSTPDLLDGAWWPRSRDLDAELPSLTAVLDPQTVPVSAAWLMATASDPLRTSTTGRLMAEAARLRAVSEADRAVQAVWDAEGGHEARGPIARPRIPAVGAPVLGTPAAARPIPDPAQGM